MKVSFVIVNYNRKEELLITLSKTKELIEKNTLKYEIVLVDNASRDGSADAVKQMYPDIVLIENPKNTGAPAWNLGFAAAKGEYFIILDDDSHIESGLDESILYLNAHPNIGVLALNVLTGPYTSAGWKMKENESLIGFIGCGAIFRRETYEKIGGYADWIFLYVNEWELGLRCLKAGYDVQFFENCRVIHRTSNINRTTKRLVVLVTKHELAIIYKYFPYKRWKYITRVALNNLKVIKGGEFRKTWFTLLGVLEFLKMRSELEHTPVSAAAQQLYISRFPGTKEYPFDFIRNSFNKNKV